MNVYNKRTSASRIIYWLWCSAIVTIILATTLAWWLLSGSWYSWSVSRSDLTQFNDFYHLLQVSNSLASERAYVNELILSPKNEKKTAWDALRKSQNKTDISLRDIPKGILSINLMNDMMEQLWRARDKVEYYQNNELNDPLRAQNTINAMVAATDFYHEALFQHTQEFLKLRPSAQGAILRAQALGELRDATGRLGAQLLIPLATDKPIPLENLQTLSRGMERIHILWWLLQTQSDELGYLPGFQLKLTQTHQTFERDGIAFINTLIAESKKEQPYSTDAKTFAVRYHDSLKSFNRLLDIYLFEIKKHFLFAEQHALIHLFLVLLILFILCVLTIWMTLYIRSRVLKPILKLNQVAIELIEGNHHVPLMNNKTPEEVQSLISSIGMLGNKLKHQTEVSEKLQQLSDQDPLTHLYNRRAFDKMINVHLQKANNDAPVWLIILDIDHFKLINDTWGHPTGDIVLTKLASTLKNYSRRNEVISRLGGEEFAIFFTSESKENVITYITRIQDKIRKLKFDGPNGDIFSITASFGVASGWKIDAYELVAKADTLLYAAKHSGRDKICGLSLMKDAGLTPRQ